MVCCRYLASEHPKRGYTSSMSEGEPSVRHSAEAIKPVKQPFDWGTIKSQLLEKLRMSNDPRSFLEYLLQFPEQHMETECWDDYLTWVYDHADEILALAKSGIPDIADEAIMVLADTHAFMEVRAGSFEEYRYEEKGGLLRDKLIAFCRENFSAFLVDDESAPYRFGLRLPALSKIIWLCGDETKTMLLRLMAHKVAVETIKNGFTDEDAREDNPLAYTDLLFDIEVAASDIILDEEIEDVAEAVAVKAGAQFDLRKERLPEASDEEKRQAHHKHLREWVASTLGLEGQARGASKELQDRFGIVNFNHYPLEVLKRQYELRDAQVPYGVLIGTQHDWNDAFNSHYSIGAMLQGFNEQVSDRGSHLRVVEVDSPRALARQFLVLEKQYGAAHKITFALVRAHGREETVQLGNEYAQTLSKKRLNRLHSENLKRFFIDQPNIMFDSCAVGAHDGLAQAVASVLDGTAQGPEDISHGIEKIDVAGEGENLAFTITLRDGAKMNVHS